MSEVDADALLVARAKQGDVKAFEMLVVKYQRRIERLIGRMVRDVDLVPDIAQESFIRAYRAIPQFRGESAFSTWLHALATIVLIGHYLLLAVLYLPAFGKQTPEVAGPIQSGQRHLHARRGEGRAVARRRHACQRDPPECDRHRCQGEIGDPDP